MCFYVFCMEKIEHIIFDKSENSETALRNNPERKVVQHQMDGVIYACKGTALSNRDGGLPSEWQNLDVWRVERVGGRFNNTGFAQYVTDPWEYSQVGASLMERIRYTLKQKRLDAKKRAAPNN